MIDADIDVDHATPGFAQKKRGKKNVFFPFFLKNAFEKKTDYFDSFKNGLSPHPTQNIIQKKKNSNKSTFD